MAHTPGRRLSVGGSDTRIRHSTTVPTVPSLSMVSIPPAGSGIPSGGSLSEHSPGAHNVHSPVSSPTSPNVVSSGHAASNAGKELVYKQQIEELQKKLKEEQDLKAELLKRAHEVLQSKKQYRELYSTLSQDKENLERELRALRDSSLGSDRTAGKLDSQSIHGKIDSLRTENAKLKRELETMNRLEASLGTEETDETRKNPEFIKATEENKKFRERVDALTVTRNDLEIQLREKDHPLDTVDRIPQEDMLGTYFVLSIEDSKSLAQKIKKMQAELWDLEIWHQQLQSTNEQLLDELNHVRSGRDMQFQPPRLERTMTNLHLTTVALYDSPNDVGKLREELEETKKGNLEISQKHAALVTCLSDIREQIKGAVQSASPFVMTDEKEDALSSLAHLMETLSVERTQYTSVRDFIDQLSEVSPNLRGSKSKKRKAKSSSRKQMSKSASHRKKTGKKKKDEDDKESFDESKE